MPRFAGNEAHPYSLELSVPASPVAEAEIPAR
jgi:hypothetical protein